MARQFNAQLMTHLGYIQQAEMAFRKGKIKKRDYDSTRRHIDDYVEYLLMLLLVVSGARYAYFLPSVRVVNPSNQTKSSRPAFTEDEVGMLERLLKPIHLRVTTVVNSEKKYPLITREENVPDPRKGLGEILGYYCPDTNPGDDMYLGVITAVCHQARYAVTMTSERCSSTINLGDFQQHLSDRARVWNQAFEANAIPFHVVARVDKS